MDWKLFVRANLDRVVGWSLISGGAVALLLGWLGASGTPLPSEQIPYIISGALGGLILVGVGTTLLISADLSDEWRKLDEIRDELRVANRSRESAASEGDGAGTTTSVDTRSRTPDGRAARSGEVAR